MNWLVRVSVFGFLLSGRVNGWGWRGRGPGFQYRVKRVFTGASVTRIACNTAGGEEPLRASGRVIRRSL